MTTASGFLHRGAALKTGDITHTPNKSGVTGRFHQSHQEKKAEEILSGEPEYQGNSMFLRLLVCFSLRQFLKSIQSFSQ